MDFIVDFLVEAGIHLFGEWFVSLCTAFLPEKMVSEKARRVIGILSLIVSLLLMAGFFVAIGLLLTTQGKSLLGWVFMGLALAYIVTAIVLRIIAACRK